MQLVKYYLDVVTPDGAGVIGYAVEWPALRVVLSGVLLWSPAAAPRVEQHRAIRGTLPRCGPAGVDWRCPALDLVGSWSAKAAPFEQTLWRNAGRRVQWSVIAAPAEASVQVGARTYRGLGYVERLELELPPWTLPIDELRWGRFLAPGHCVVWIRWDHAEPRQWVWHNGHLAPSAVIGDNGVTWSDGSLELGSPQSLRSGRLADTVFARWPAVRQLVPRHIGAFEEHKWCSPGVLSGAGEPPARGHVIHERVRLR